MLNRQVKDLEDWGSQQQFKRVQGKMMQWAESFELLRWPRAWTNWETLPGKREVFTWLFCCKSNSIHSIVGLPFVQKIELKFQNQISQHWQNEGVGWSKQELWQSVTDFNKVPLHLTGKTQKQKWEVNEGNVAVHSCTCSHWKQKCSDSWDFITPNNSSLL